MPYTTLSSTSVIFRFSKDALSLHSSTAQKRIFVFNNIARLETVPEGCGTDYKSRKVAPKRRGRPAKAKAVKLEG